MGQQITVGKDAQLKQGESFEWVTPGMEECEVFRCKPPLEQDPYKVKPGVPTPAKVSNDAEK
jgi:hypothetical protein